MIAPLALLEQARAEGVDVTISAGGVKASGDPAAVSRWLPSIREHKPAIVALLTAANDAKVGAGETAVSVKHSQWLIHYADRDPVEVHCTPPASHAEVLSSRPEAIAAVPLSASPKGMESLAAADVELLHRWFDHVGGGDPDDFGDLVESCMKDDEAMACYRTAASDADIIIDDRRTCSQCLNLRGQVCGAAVKLGASRTYRPMLMVSHPGRCLEYLPGPNDYDRSIGRKRWAGMAAMEAKTAYGKDWQ